MCPDPVRRHRSSRSYLSFVKKYLCSVWLFARRYATSFSLTCVDRVKNQGNPEDGVLLAALDFPRAGSSLLASQGSMS